MNFKDSQIHSLIKSLDQIIESAQKLERTFSSEISSSHPEFEKSAQNLLHYLALRNFDIRELQEALAEMGLSSLGRSEGHVLSSLFLVRNHLCRIAGCPELSMEKQLPGIQENREILERHVESLLGKRREGRGVRIMVTLSGEDADNYPLIKNLIERGMDCARINCAHDNKEIWIKLIDNVHLAVKETGLSCKILMDLAGLKLRTGPIKSGPQLVRIKAKRDFYGKLLRPARIWLGAQGTPIPNGIDQAIPVDEKWVTNLQPGDKINFEDKRGKKRSLIVLKVEKNGCIAELHKRSYLESGTLLFLKDKKRELEPTQVGPLPPIHFPLVLHKGDILLLHKAAALGENAKHDEQGLVIEPAHISCSNPEIFDFVKAGDPILFNDGKIEGVITSSTPDLLVIKITFAKAQGSLLREDKGINLPNTDIGISGLQKKDYEDLPFVARHADIINMSFVNHPEDILELEEQLRKLNATHLGIMVKIETRTGFHNLPKLLLQLMKNHSIGVMIARGDLAVECGWEKLAEIQEEILWLCEAAHVPVVWATQVLESLSQKGAPSRAEITDAAMSQRADCVMLNKGPHILQTVEMLSRILERMQLHQHKKTAILKNLKFADSFHLPVER